MLVVTSSKMERGPIGEKAFKILMEVQRSIDVNGWAPAYRELQESIGISSTSVVRYNMDILEENGYIERGYGQARAIRVVTPPCEANLNFDPIVFAKEHQTSEER